MVVVLCRYLLTQHFTYSHKYFRTFFGNFATKDNLDLLIHHPYLLSDDLSILHNYTSGILFDILNYILTYERV